MQALILNSDRATLRAHTTALLKHGYSVVNATSLEEAQDYSRLGTFDLLLMEERVEGRLTHTISLIAEQKKEDVVTVLVTDRVDGALNELTDLLPSLNCFVGTKVSDSILTALIDAEMAYLAAKQAPVSDVQSDWFGMDLGTSLAQATMRTGVTPSLQRTNYDGPWPQSPFDVARLEQMIARQANAGRLSLAG